MGYFKHFGPFSVKSKIDGFVSKIKLDQQFLNNFATTTITLVPFLFTWLIQYMYF